MSNINISKDDDPYDNIEFLRALEIYSYAEDILFNMLFSSQDNFKHSHRKGNHKRSSNSKKKNRLDHLKWTIDEFTNMYTSSGLDDLIRHNI